ncbi:EF hand domain-containing protein [Sarcoptes scabiei]|nr:EF hand domain-containing protein [Sarcoptes scabiei]
MLNLIDLIQSLRINFFKTIVDLISFELNHNDYFSLPRSSILVNLFSVFLLSIVIFILVSSIHLLSPRSIHQTEESIVEQLINLISLLMRKLFRFFWSIFRLRKSSKLQSFSIEYIQNSKDSSPTNLDFFASSDQEKANESDQSESIDIRQSVGIIFSGNSIESNFSISTNEMYRYC